MDLDAKWARIGETSNETQITQTRYRKEIIRLWEQAKPTLHPSFAFTRFPSLSPSLTSSFTPAP